MYYVNKSFMHIGGSTFIRLLQQPKMEEPLHKIFAVIMLAVTVATFSSVDWNLPGPWPQIS